MIERATAMSELLEHQADGIAGLIDAVAEAEHIEDWVLLARALHNLSNATHGAERRAYLERMREAGRRRLRQHGRRQLPRPPRSVGVLGGRRLGGVGPCVAWAPMSRAGPVIGRSPCRSSCCSKSTEWTRPRHCWERGPAVPSQDPTTSTACRHNT